MDRIDRMIKAKEKLEAEIRMKLIFFAMDYKVEEMNISGSLELTKVPPHPLNEVGDMYGFNLGIDILDYQLDDK